MSSSTTVIHYGRSAGADPDAATRLIAAPKQPTIGALLQVPAIR